MEHLPLHAGGEGVLALLPRVLGRRVRRHPRAFPRLLLYGTLGWSGNALQSLGRAVKLQYQMLALYDCLVRAICSKYLSLGAGGVMFVFSLHNNSKLLQLNYIKVLRNY